jgi:hypothetical protein
LADEALTSIGTRFHLEQRGTGAQRHALHQRYNAPILEHFNAWLDRHLPATAPKTLLGKATRKQWIGFS